MHVHVIPGPQRTVTIHHSGDCLVAVVVDAHLRRVVRLAHSDEHATAYARAGRGLWADLACWDDLDELERRAPCICQAAGTAGPCAQVFRGASHGTPVAA